MTTENIISKVVPLARAAKAFLSTFAAPILDLSIRIWIGMVFFRSGLLKAQDWESTVFLFKDEYHLPILPPEIAAALGMTAEIAMPVFLFVGLAARLAAVPLILMTCVIQFILGASMPDYDSTEHFYWLFLLSMTVVRGPGTLSLDHLIAKRFAV